LLPTPKRIYMSNLFVDVDDTLILYDRIGPNPYGIYFGEPYSVNDELLRGILDFHKNNPNSLIVIWSGGGKQYAEMWIDRIGLGDIIPSIVGLGKDRDSLVLVKDGDIVIDDDILGGLRTHNPNEWPEK